GLLFRYDGKGKRFLVLNTWEKGRAKRSEYPEPPADVCERMQTYVYMSSHMSPTPTPTPTPTNDTDTNAADAAAIIELPGLDQSDKPKRQGFVQPSPEEVTAYSLEIGYPMDGQAWCDSYAAKGWMIGKAKMKDWK